MKEIPLITPLQKFYQYEKEKANQTFLRQAINDQWIHYSWKETGEIIRTMAAAIQAQNYPKGTKIAILSANCAHWIMADLAIMMTGCICSIISNNNCRYNRLLFRTQRV
ncbi:MAG: AMP-binding protein [Chitinophagales bacterium]